MTVRWLLSCAAIALCPTLAVASPLTVEQCAAHASDVATLDKAGVKALLEKGPAATKASLTRDQRDQVRRYLDLLGQMRFRCPSDAPLVTLRAEPPEDAAEAAATTAPIDAGTPGITLPAGVAAAVVAPVVPKKPAVPKKAATAKAEPGTAKAPAKSTTAKAARSPPAPVEPAPPAAPAALAPVRPKPAAKPKADDALRPPPPGASPAQKTP